ncbi:ABC transporter ATP-binding protein [Aestuariivirga litoralis]|uniref:ABC transporter ATP-binding protein n=1 Tax=Aestuariivirga litoralis TaxID=2650924 RepID=UPI0018C46365|nr:ABC transporter ATP-binding protein [Aestuariivirga litoralis]MBG1230773.1 ABC transporter ATP-binding protein [Aestuariivirga litoralis]
MSATVPEPSSQFISIRSVTKKFADFAAVNDVSLDIGKGELFALLGGSGCGKTTLLRMLAGFEAPTAGQIFIDGQDMAGVPPYERPVNMMFQSYALFPHMSVEKNVGYGLKHEKMTAAQRKDRVKEMLDLVKLTHLAGRKPHQLSGGQRQRVALARSLARQPKLLLLDEPLGALDKKLREHTQFEIANIQYKTGVTFVVVTHDQEEAMTLASRIAVMDRGIVRQIGTPTDVHEFPNSKFVASFIGSANMFEAEVTAADGGVTEVSVPQLGTKLSAATSQGWKQGEKIACAFRPEKVLLSREQVSGAANTIKGVVQDFGYFGKDSLYRIKLASGAVVSVNTVNAQRRGEKENVATWEDEVFLTLDPRSVMLFADQA